MMKFDEYVNIIIKSVRESGYDQFYPSRCVPGETMQMDVLYTELTEAGEEELAKQWAEQIIRPDETLYLAYRCGNRTVSVIELCGFTGLKKQDIEVKEYI